MVYPEYMVPKGSEPYLANKLIAILLDPLVLESLALTNLGGGTEEFLSVDMSIKC